MISEKQNIKISKFLSLVLRHKPEAIGITLDENGWTNVDILIEKVNAAGTFITPAVLKHVVDTNSKKRFAFSDDLKMIRASQGHSIDIELGYEPKEPPAILYHGTAEPFIESIFKTGLEKRKRHHVHLSKDFETATKVGQRHGKVIVLEVLSGEMHNEGFEFFVSENNVWLTDHVPVKYLRKNL
ncbi:MAG: 2-phosphotransferase [Bacteroidetes bacterium]|jgi:putative RNA 2'-phosphotransferase|nr:2-phosphotransferase [Bacteroidota bacterium]